jgi:hypothetical protein
VSVSNLRRATFNLPYPEGSWPYKTVNETTSTYIPVSDFLDAPFSFSLEKGLVTTIQVRTRLYQTRGWRQFHSNSALWFSKLQNWAKIYFERHWYIYEWSVVKPGVVNCLNSSFQVWSVFCTAWSRVA